MLRPTIDEECEFRSAAERTARLRDLEECVVETVRLLRRLKPAETIIREAQDLVQQGRAEATDALYDEYLECLRSLMALFEGALQERRLLLGH